MANSRLHPHVLILSLSLLLVASVRVVAQSRPDQAESSFARALQLHQSGDLDGAIALYREILSTHPDRVEARSNLAAAYARLGRYEEAIEQYKYALGSSGGNAAIRFNLGLAYYKAMMIREAVTEFSQVVASQPQNRNALTLLADCFLRLGENRRVIELLSPLKEAALEDRSLSYLIGMALIRDGQVDQGQKIIDRILRDGESAEARLMLGTAHMKVGDFKSALKEFARAAELNPQLPSVNSFYGRALLETGDGERALEAFKRELRLNPNDFDANLYLGVLLKQERRYPEALSFFERALRLRPGAVEVRYQIGNSLFHSGDITGAQRVLEELVRDAPSFVEAHVTLATVYYRLKRKEDGDRQRAIVRKLEAQIQARAPVAPEGGQPPAPRGDDQQRPNSPPEEYR